MIERAINLIPWWLRDRIRLIPGVAQFQRYIFRSLFADRSFIHLINAGPAKGLHFPVHLPEDKGIWTGTYEVQFAERLAAAVKPGAICFDIGGFRGFFSGLMGVRGARSVTVFEPLAENCSRIADLQKCNPALPLELRQCAIGEEDGEVEFLVMIESSMGKLARSEFQPEASGISSIKVPVRSLDSLIASGEITEPDLVKVDVEGAEAAVLNGALQLLRNKHPQIFVEIHTRASGAACASLLTSNNYQITVLETGLAPDSEKDPEVCHYIASERAV